MSRIIIIGGGVAGLAAGIRAQLNGMEAVIVERHAAAGGNLTGWDREGYHIDNCIHWLTGTNPVTGQYRVWRELGVLGEGDVRQGEALYTYTQGGENLSLSRDIGRLERDLLARSCGDDREIVRLIRAVRAARTACGISAYADDRSATAAEKALWAPLLLRYLPLSTGALAERFNSPVIRGFLLSLLGRHFGALALLIVFATYCSGNGGLPAGSSRAAAQRMAERFRSLGGVLLCGAPAARVDIDGGRAHSVTLADGRRLAARAVVLACDPACAFGRLLDRSYTPARLLRCRRDPRLRLFSSFHCAFGVEGEAPPFTGDLILPAPARLRRAFGTDYLILREFSHEPSFAPAGHSLLQALCFCTQENSERFLRLSGDRVLYRAEKELLSDWIAEAVREQFPQLEGRMRCVDCWTPATYRRYTGSPTGSYIGYTLPSGRIPSRIPSRVKGVANLYLATQWQQSPGGLPTAAAAGCAAVDAILRDERRHSAQPEPSQLAATGESA